MKENASKQNTRSMIVMRRQKECRLLPCEAVFLRTETGLIFPRSLPSFAASSHPAHTGLGAGDHSDALPPGPTSPPTAQMLSFLLTPGPFLRACRERYGKVVTLGVVNSTSTSPWA